MVSGIEVRSLKMNTEKKKVMFGRTRTETIKEEGQCSVVCVSE